MAKLTPLESAQLLALRGDVDQATLKLQALKESGNSAACASLAEVAAYRGQWSAVLENAERALLAPDSLENLSVYGDLALLAARAGKELRSWSKVAALAHAAAKALTSDPGDETRRSVAKRLAESASAKDMTPLLAQSTDQEDVRRTKFEAALTKMKETKMKFRSPADRLDHLFGLARAYRYNAGATRVFDEEEKLPNLFPNVVFLASSLTLAGRTQDALGAIQSAIPRWWPVASSQVAPVALVVDAPLVSVIPQSFYDKLLHTPRGPAIT